MPNTHTAIPSHSLHLRQTRMINATEGFRLEVRSGCLWLTRPGDPVDHFLTAGTAIDLHENLVLLQCDKQPGCADAQVAHYALVPLATGNQGPTLANAHQEVQAMRAAGPLRAEPTAP
jgi:hypothetical protein